MVVEPMQQTPRVRPGLAVILRTLADAKRSRVLLRAIDSIGRLRAVETATIVVVNGTRYEPSLLETLYARPDIKVIYSENASAGAAIVHGRHAVDREFFIYLDDDDELIENGIDVLLKEHSQQLDWDILVANGVRRSAGGDTPWVEQWERHVQDPLASLVNENWLSPGNTVFRARSIDAGLLDVDRDHHEWTYIAYQLLLKQLRARFIDRCVVIYNDTSESLSKSPSHWQGELRLLEDLRSDVRLSGEHRHAIECKYRNLLHMAAEWNRSAGHLRRAWYYHLRSLRSFYGLRYLPFTRKILIPNK